MKYFNNCHTLDELKKEFRRLCMIHHPDRGGDNATMAAIINEHDEAFKRLQNQHNASHDEQHQNTETPEEFRSIVVSLLNLDGLEVELCGSWLWISGETLKHKEALKVLGCRWSSSKKMWYWRHQENGDHWSHGRKSMAQIRSKYGSQSFGKGTASQALEQGA